MYNMCAAKNPWYSSHLREFYIFKLLSFLPKPIQNMITGSRFTYNTFFTLIFSAIMVVVALFTKIETALSTFALNSTNVDVSQNYVNTNYNTYASNPFCKVGFADEDTDITNSSKSDEILRLHNVFFDCTKLKQNPINIILYTKNNCKYCTVAKELLSNQTEFNVKVVNITDLPELHQRLIEKTGQKTVPYIFINTYFIGGSTDLET